MVNYNYIDKKNVQIGINSNYLLTLLKIINLYLNTK